MHASVRHVTLIEGVSFNLDAFMAAQADGIYFDTTKTDRFFQENTGPTLADDVGEAMGLALSQRAWNGQTLAELLAGQTELVANGGFDTNTVWSASGVTASNTAVIADGKLTINSADGANVQVTQGFPVPSGRLLCIEFFIDSLSSGSWGIADGGAVIATGSTTGLHRLFYTSPDAALSLDIKRGSGVTNFVMDRISVKEVPGKRGIQATGTLKPTRQTTGAKFDGSDDNWLTSYTAGAGENFIVALVTVPTTLGAFQYITAASGASNANRFGIGINTDGLVGFGVGSVSPTIAKGVTDVRNTEVVVGLTCNGSTVLGFAGSSQEYSAVQSSTPTTTIPLRVGAHNGDGVASTFFGGSIKKLVVGRQFLDLATYLKIRTALLAA